ncbi:nucleoprotein [Aphelenchoides fujianensis]|nr:nucleoprotein [Aphelenchoides fujianensis]
MAAAFNPWMVWGITGGLMILIYLVLVLALAGWSVWRNQKIRQKKAYLQLTPYYDTDFNLLRWLQGHNYKIDEILPKLRNHLTFRRSRWDLDHAADKPRDHPIHAHWKAGLSGLSGKIPNSFINVEQTGANDYWGLLQTYPLNEIMRAEANLTN